MSIHEYCWAVVMIHDVVAMAVHRPVQVFCDTVRMAVMFDQLKMISNGLDDCWRMAEGRPGGPYHERHAKQAGKYLLCYAV